jgi:branched-chain amino acid transport system permease protein
MKYNLFLCLLPLLFIILFSIGMRVDGQIQVILVISSAVAVFYFVIFAAKIINPMNIQSISKSPQFLLTSLAILIALPLTQLSQPYVVYIEIRIFVLSITLMAFAISFGLAGMVDLGIIAYLGIGAYISARFSMSLHMPVYLTSLLASIISFCVAGLIGQVILKLRGHYFTLASIGVGLIGYHLFILAVPLTLGTDGIANIPGLSIFGISPEKSIHFGGLIFPYKIIPYYWTLLGMSTIFYIVNSFDSIQFGRCLKAVRDDETVAIGFGINPIKYRLIAYTIGAAIAGFAGALYAHTVNYIAPNDFGLQTSIYLLALVILGNFGKPLPMIIVAFIFVYLEEKLQVLGGLRMILLSCSILIIILSRSRISSK